MECAKNNKSRCANFSKEQSELLVEIVRNHPIIENTSKHKNVIDLKEDAWKQIYTEFSAVNIHGPPRTQEQLESKYRFFMYYIDIFLRFTIFVY
jgi:hypothetical protein